VFNATNGAHSLDALELVPAESLAGKIVVDVSNPLDFSRGMPPTLTVCNTDSIGERIQALHPAAHVVKTLNTVTASLMVDPGQLAGGDHDLFVAGNDADAKAQVSNWLREWFGWRHITDLGDITAARGLEMYLPIWLCLYGASGTPMFNVKVVKAE
jgi:predicted dinucleotide-binding enzyme